MNKALYGALRRLLRPLVRYLISQGYTLAAFTEVVRTLYMEEAIAGGGARATDSHLSLVTGIHRKEIKRLRATLADDQTESLPPADNLAAQLVAAWVSSPDTRGGDGPLSLPLRDPVGPSIETLTRAIKADMRPRAILDVLLQTGVVARTSNGRYRLLRSAFVPDLPEDKLAFLGTNVGDHLRSALHNLQTTEPFLERALYIDAIPADALATLRPDIRKAADELLQNLNRALTPFEQPVSTPNSRRLRIGVYYYEDMTVDAHETS